MTRKKLKKHRRPQIRVSSFFLVAVVLGVKFDVKLSRTEMERAEEGLTWMKILKENRKGKKKLM